MRCDLESSSSQGVWVVRERRGGGLVGDEMRDPMLNYGMRVRDGWRVVVRLHL
jgi:hypothetical protein